MIGQWIEHIFAAVGIYVAVTHARFWLQTRRPR